MPRWKACISAQGLTNPGGDFHTAVLAVDRAEVDGRPHNVHTACVCQRWPTLEPALKSTGGNFSAGEMSERAVRMERAAGVSHPSGVRAHAQLPRPTIIN